MDNEDMRPMQGFIIGVIGGLILWSLIFVFVFSWF